MAADICFKQLTLDENGNIDQPQQSVHKKDDDVSEATIIYSASSNEWKMPSNDSNKTQKDTFSFNLDFWSIFSSIFLPIGYPSSVTSDYGIFQIMDSIQALCSYLRGLLTTRSTLIGIGVGKSSANATSATIQFIFRDLTGYIGSVIFSWKYSYSFGIEIKQWRLFADVINDIALTLELLSPLFPSICFVPILCIASLCKAMCGCSAGATRVGIAKHFALKDNETDLIAKEGIQETFVTILGMILGLILTSCLNENEYEFVIIVTTFVILTFVHVIANYFAVKSLQLKTLNRERLNIVITHYLKDCAILTPEKVCLFENVWKVHLFGIHNLFNSKKDKMIRLNLGVKINEIMPIWIKWNLNRNGNKKYFIGVCLKKNVAHIGIAFDVNANDFDFIESFLMYRIIAEWIWKQMKENKEFTVPNDALQIPTQKELNKNFHEMMKQSQWKINDLRSSLGVMSNRHSQVSLD